MSVEEELLEIEFKQKNGLKLTRDEKKLLKDNSAEEKDKRSKMSFGDKLKAASKTEYAQLMGKNEVDNFPIRDWISTGNYLFNSQLSGYHNKGIPSGRVCMLAGIASTGKSFIGLETAKHAQDMGYFVVIFDSEMANNDKSALEGRGLDLERVLYIPIDTVEALKTSLLNILEEITDEKVIVLCDSIGNLSTKKELGDSLAGEDTRDMTRSAQLKALFRTVTLKAGIKNVPIIVINHTYSIIGGFMSGGQQVAGGGGPMYNASIIAEFTKAQEKGADGRMSGALVTSTVSKCRTAKERTKIKFTIDFDNGLTKTSGLLLFCMDEKLIGKDKRSFVFAPKTKFKQGERFSTITDELWEEFLDFYLGEYMNNKFKYQSTVPDDILDDDSDGDD